MAADRQSLERIWASVATIRPGSVASYGAVAAAAGLPGRARFVGHALRIAPGRLGLPWHRVVGAGGRLCLPEGSAADREQRRRLVAEGLCIRGRRVVPGRDVGREALDRALWGPPPLQGGRRDRR